MPKQRAQNRPTNGAGTASQQQHSVQGGLKYGHCRHPPQPAPLQARQPQRGSIAAVATPIALPWEPAPVCFIIEGAVSASEADTLRAWLERCGNWEPAMIGSGVDATVRNSLRVMWDDPCLTENLWNRVARFMPAEIRGGCIVGFNERLRFLKYGAGHFFAPHEDTSYAREGRSGERSYLTALLYLSDPGEHGGGDGDGGGSTRFISPDCPSVRRDGRCDGACVHCVDARMSKGSVLIFAHELTHAGTLLQSGEKVVMRTDVMYTPPSIASRSCHARGRRGSGVRLGASA